MYTALVLLALVAASGAQRLPKPSMIPGLIPPTEGPSPPPEYVITCSKYMRVNQDYVIDVQLLGNKGFTLTAAIVKREHYQSNTTETFLSQALDVAAGSPSTQMRLTVPGRDVMQELNHPYYYAIVVSASGELTFSQHHTLTLLRDTTSVFVQTDKAMYKPGDKVQFRVFATDMSLVPIPGPFDIKIQDASNNILRQWLDQRPEGGLFSAEVQLSKYVNKGMWTIQVAAPEADYAKQFQVEEYVLPKFEVNVKLPSYTVVLKDNSLDITISAMYTFGQPVAGKADVTITIERYSMHAPPIPSLKFLNQKLDKAGETKLSVPLSDLCQDDRVCSLNDLLYIANLAVTANVTESATDITLSGGADVNLVDHSIVVKWHKSSPTTFKLGFPITVLLSVTQPDGKPIEDRYLSTPITITATMYCFSQWNNLYDPRCKSHDFPIQTRTIPVDGLVPVSMDLSTVLGGGFETLTLKAELKDPVVGSTRSAHSTLNAFLSTTGQAVTVVQDGDVTAPLAPGNRYDFIVSSQQPFTTFRYQVYSRGSLVTAQLVNVPNATTAIFSLDLDDALAREMAPEARILVSLITESGEMVADTLLVQVEGEVANDVHMFYSAEEVSPGQRVSVTGRAAPNSKVALLAVDQSVLLLAGGNDITDEDVRGAYASYDPVSGSRDGWDCGWFRRQRRSIMPPCWSFDSGTTTTDLYENNGVYVITDATIYDNPDEFPSWQMARMPSVRRGPQNGAPGPPPRGERPVGVPGAMGPPPPSPPSGKTAAKPKPRKLFPETFIFSEKTTGADGTFDLTGLHAPDTITSWVLTGFALHPTLGLGVAEPAKLRVFKSFFVSLSLPYSMVRTEKFALKATVFNYLTAAQTVRVRLGKSLQYKTQVSGADLHSDAVSNIQIEGNSVKSVTFWVLPVTLGSIDLEVFAQASDGQIDALKRKVLVKAEGVEGERTQSELILLENGDTWEKVITPWYPDVVIEGSQRLAISAVGNALGPAMNNLDSLLKMPTGCGEQNMIYFAPDVFVSQYLEATGQVTSSLMATALNYMRSGYMRELTYQRTDGSYSAFGNSDPEGSTWLTAFVTKTFCQARQYLDVIDEQSVMPGIKFLIQQQDENGSFISVGRVLHDDLMGGSSDGLALSAYVTIAFSECKKAFPNTPVGQAVNKVLPLAVARLEEALPRMAEQPYTLAITAYALGLEESSSAATALDLLQQHATEEDGLTYWSVEPPKPATEWSQATSVDIELTSYAMLATLLIGGGAAEATPIAKWLTTKQNKLGGYSSTQDTVLALQALTSYILATYSSGSGTLRLTVTAGGNTYRFDEITDVNRDLLQTMLEVPWNAGPVTISAAGVGTALVQVTTEYNTPVPPPAGTIDLRVDSTAEGSVVDVVTCINWTGDKTSGMAVVEINALSGMEIDDASGLVSQFSRQGMRLAEPMPNNNGITLYFDELPLNEQICPRVRQRRAYDVVGVQPAFASAYRYYNQEVTERRAYLPMELAAVSVCDMCQGDECGQECGDDKGGPAVGPWIPGSAGRVGPPLMGLLLAVALLAKLIT